MGYFDGQITEKRAVPPRPAAGKHRVLIEWVGMVKTFKHGLQPTINFRILRSETEPVGKLCGHQIVLADDVYGYKKGELLNLGRSINGSLGGDPQNTEESKQEMSKVLDDANYGLGAVGLELDVTSIRALDKTTREPITGKNGPVFNLTFEPVEGQTEESIAAGRAQVDAWQSAAPKETPAEKPIETQKPVELPRAVVVKPSMMSRLAK